MAYDEGSFINYINYPVILHSLAFEQKEINTTKVLEAVLAYGVYHVINKNLRPEMTLEEKLAFTYETISREKGIEIWCIEYYYEFGKHLHDKYNSHKRTGSILIDSIGKILGSDLSGGKVLKERDHVAILCKLALNSLIKSKSFASSNIKAVLIRASGSQKLKGCKMATQLEYYAIKGRFRAIKNRLIANHGICIYAKKKRGFYFTNKASQLEFMIHMAMKIELEKTTKKRVDNHNQLVKQIEAKAKKNLLNQN